MYVRLNYPLLQKLIYLVVVFHFSTQLHHALAGLQILILIVVVNFINKIEVIIVHQHSIGQKM